MNAIQVRRVAPDDKCGRSWVLSVPNPVAVVDDFPICAIMPVVVGLINNDCNVDCTAAFVQDGDGCHDECCG